MFLVIESNVFDASDSSLIEGAVLMAVLANA